MTTPAVTAATCPVTRRVRAYFAPVDRASGTPAIFDAAQSGAFDLEAPPAPWVDLGWCTEFERKSGTKMEAVQSGAPANVQAQVRTQIQATVSIQFESWGKLQLALASGSQQMNLLATAAGAAANGSGGTAVAAIPLAPYGNSSATQLNVGDAASAGFAVGDLVVVDVDYAGQTGYVGAGVSGAYVKSSAAVRGDANYIRRISLNVGRVVSAGDGVLVLASSLPAGTPAPDMKVSLLVGFVDREGGSFFQEWSGLFVMEGEQGDRVIFHYPRLQTLQGSAEAMTTLSAPLEKLRLSGEYLALPVQDANDGETALCFRSYLPGPMRAV